MEKKEGKRSEMGRIRSSRDWGVMQRVRRQRRVCTRYWIKRGDHRVIVTLDSWIIVEFNGVSGVC